MTIYAFYAAGKLRQIAETTESRARQAATRNNEGIKPTIWYGKIAVSASPIVQRLSLVGFTPKDRAALLEGIAVWS